MGYRCVVIDDEKPARERIKRLLADHPDFELVGEAANADAAVALIEAQAPDLCFLDVRMPEGDGFDVLGRLDALPNVIFTTAFDQYAVRAFEVHSLDYLLKPFSKRRFAEALERSRKVLERQPDSAERILGVLDQIRRGFAERRASAVGASNKISGRRGSRIVLLDLPGVLYFEAEETLVFARTARGRFLVERTLVDLEHQLAPGFFRAHRRYLVNLDAIREILPAEAGTYRIVLRGEEGREIPLSRRQARKLRELIPW